jgi:hypothetical protein
MSISPIRTGGPRDDVVLPGATADDEIDVAVARGAKPDRARERVRVVPAADVHVGLGQSAPQRLVERPNIDGEEVLVERRATDPVHREGAGANQRVRDPVTLEDCDDLLEERHMRLPSATAEGVRPPRRDCAISRFASSRDTPRAAHTSARSSSPSRNASSTRSFGVRRARSLRDSVRRASATDRMAAV